MVPTTLDLVAQVVRHWASQPANSDLLARLSRAHQLVLTREIAWDWERRSHMVESSASDCYYRVDLDARTCECADLVGGGAPRGWCKHLLAVAIIGAAQTLQQRRLEADGQRLPNGLSWAAIQWQRLMSGQAVCQDRDLAEAV